MILFPADFSYFTFLFSAALFSESRILSLLDTLFSSISPFYRYYRRFRHIRFIDVTAAAACSLLALLHDFRFTAMKMRYCICSHYVRICPS